MAFHDYCGCGLSEARNFMDVAIRRNHGDTNYLPYIPTSIKFPGINYPTEAGVIAAQTFVACDSESEFFLEFLEATGDVRKVLPVLRGGESSPWTKDALWATFTFLPDFWLSCICAFQHTRQFTLHNSKFNKATKPAGASLPEAQARDVAQAVAVLRKSRTSAQVVIWKHNSCNCAYNFSIWMPKLPGQRKSLGRSLFHTFRGDGEVTLCLGEP